MNRNRRMWLTNQDVLQDLARVTGVPCAGDVDSYLVSGERPPPTRNDLEIDDDEIRLMFGDHINATGDYNCNEPDLDGITKCIRMAQQNMGRSDSHNPKETRSPEKRHQTEIVISKLNPEVQEFVPIVSRSSSSNSPHIQQSAESSKGSSPMSFDSPRNSYISINSSQVTSEDAAQRIEPHSSILLSAQTSVRSSPILLKQYKTQSEANVNHKIDKTKTHENERDKIISTLKDQIAKIPSNSSLDKRRAKNTAIAALMKAHSSPVHSSPSSQPNPVLLTPEYFQSHRQDENVDQRDIVGNLEVDAENISSSTSVTPQTVSAQTDVEKNENVTKTERNGPKIEASDVERPKTPVDPCVKEAIEKVERWLNSPEPNTSTTENNVNIVNGDIKKTSDNPKNSEPKSPIPIKPLPLDLSGSNMFKKKCVVRDNISPRTTSKSSLPVNKTPSYVPSKYAENLAKTYEKRKEAIEGPLDIWSQLERDLKIRDEEIRRRAREKESQIDNATRNVN